MPAIKEYRSYGKEIEDILVKYPYLIDESFIDGDLKRQYKVILSNNSVGYIDIIYFKQKEIIVVELKKDIIIKQDITQLSEYVNQIKNEFPNKEIRGFLVGKNIPGEFKRSLKLRGIKFKKLTKDIPLKLKLCDNCRKALRVHDELCKWCNHNTFINI